ncbi:MAG: response regulator [Bacteroidota bacterium]
MINKIKESILYVDDEKANLDGFKYAFMLDYDIAVAENAKDGLKIMGEKDFKIVISDQKMPETSGIEFLKVVKEKYPDTLRIVLTAYADIENAIEAINKGGIYRYLSKPWDKTDLKLTIDNALEAYNLKKENRDLILRLQITNKELNEKIVEIEENEEELKKQNEEYVALNNELKASEEEYRATNEELIATTQALEENNKELLKAKSRVEESDRLKTEFINNMSHEIRTPMNGILGFSRMLNMHRDSEEKQQYYINIIQSSGNQLMRIIDDILEISRLGTKQVVARNEEVCLNDLLLNLFSVFDIKAKENKTPLYLKKGLSDKESTIFTDKSKLNKILSNLLENALKFTNDGFVEFGYSLQENNIQLYVKDTGIGIAASSQQIIFERFSQEAKELSKIVGGLGLGLSIAKENAELLGGKITIKSEKGKGSTFFITIPYNPVNIEPKISKPDNGKVTNRADKYIILVVEDEEVNYLYLETLFVYVIDLNCTVLHAKNGKEAVDMCKNNAEINFVFMDLKMPVMNGYEASRQIREFRPGLPIVAQTAYSTKEDEEKAKRAGCDDFISKPIDENSIKKVLYRYISQK